MARAYRSIWTTHKSNIMRLICYPADPNCTKFITILMNRMTYGDTIAAACLEITCREILAQKCRTALARDILLNQRYVDDTTGGNEQKAAGGSSRHL